MQTSLLVLSFSLFFLLSWLVHLEPPPQRYRTLNLAIIKVGKVKWYMKPSPWSWCLGILLGQVEKTKATLRKIPERKGGECHLYTALLHPHLSCFFPFALSFIQIFNYLVYILSTYCRPGTDICTFLVTAGLSTDLFFKSPRRSPKIPSQSL